jgi:hypothetical protein
MSGNWNSYIFKKVTYNLFDALEMRNIIDKFYFEEAVDFVEVKNVLGQKTKKVIHD